MTYLITFFLVLLSGIFSGLNLGLMGLDPYELKRKIALGDENAKKIFPIRKRGNLLLVTLLLGNVAVNAALSIFLGSIASGLIAGIVSTALITIFGEIIPQATFSRFALQFGAKMVWLVKLFMFVLLPICWPIAFLLDKILGHEIPTIYSRAELIKILEEHRSNNSSEVQADEERIAKGALTFGEKSVKDIMTPRSKIMALHRKQLLTKKVLRELRKAGFSRVLVFKKTMDQVDGILYLHDLAGLKTGVHTAGKLRRKKVYYVHEDTNLDYTLNAFLKTKHHLFPVINEHQEVTGIITLEDVLEEILGKEILDEFDQQQDVKYVAELRAKEVV